MSSKDIVLSGNVWTLVQTGESEKHNPQLLHRSWEEIHTWHQHIDGYFVFAVKFPTKQQLCWLQHIIFCKLCVFAPVFVLMPLITILLWKKPTRQFTTKAFSSDGAMSPQCVHQTDFIASVSFSCAASEGHFAKKVSHRWHHGKCFHLAFGDRIHDVRIKRWL